MNASQKVTFSIREYTLEPPFNSDRVYMAIFRDDEKTNFWAIKGNEDDEIRLHKYLNLLQSGIIDSRAEDQCAACQWTPAKVKVYSIENIPMEVRQIMDSYTNKLFSISGSKTDRREQQFIDRAKQPHITQYSKILKTDLSGICDTCAVIVYPYGVDYYAI